MELPMNIGPENDDICRRFFVFFFFGGLPYPTFSHRETMSVFQFQANQMEACNEVWMAST